MFWQLDIRPDGKSDFSEVRFFFRLRFGADDIYSLALVSVFSQPDLRLLENSNQTVYSCHYQGDMALRVVDIKTIKSVVSMVPYFKVTQDGEIIEPETEHFLLEKPGLCIAELVGEEEDDDLEGLYAVA
jgi:hypothetical protein